MQDRTALRLGAALAVSIALHLSLIYGVTVVPPRPGGDAVVIHARVTPAPEEVSSSGPDRSRPDRPRARGPAPERATLATPAAPVEPPPALAAEPSPSATGRPQVEMPLLSDPTWYPARQLDVYPKLIAPVQPRYPDEAARDNVAGAVTLLVMVDENGLVREASVAEADPQGYFEDAALEAFHGARFSPAAKDGRVVRSRILIRVTFNPEAQAARRD